MPQGSLTTAYAQNWNECLHSTPQNSLLPVFSKLVNGATMQHITQNYKKHDYSFPHLENVNNDEVWHIFFNIFLLLSLLLLPLR